MKHKIKFKAIDNTGVVITFVEEFETPKFTKQDVVHIKGIALPGSSVVQQVMNWLDDMDKKEIMIKHNLNQILDYTYYKATKKQDFYSYLKSLNFEETVLMDILACYKAIEPIIFKGKSNAEKLNLIISHVKIGYMASSNVYTQIVELFENKTPKVNLLENKPKS